MVHICSTTGITLATVLLLLTGKPDSASAAFTFLSRPDSGAYDYIDTSAFDHFHKLAGFVSASSNTSATTLNGAITYSINGGTLSGDGLTSTLELPVFPSVTSGARMGTLTLYTQTGAFIFAPSNDAINGNAGIPNAGPVRGADSAATSGSSGMFLRQLAAITARDVNNASASSNLFIARLGFYNDTPLPIPGTAPIGTTVSETGVPMSLSIPMSTVFNRVDTSGSGNISDDINVLRYSAYIGSDENLFTSTQEMDTASENISAMADWPALSSKGLSFTATPSDTSTSILTISGTPNSNGIIDIMLVATDSPDNSYSVKRFAGRHMVVYVGTAGNDAPYITSNTTVTVPENSPAVLTVTSLDPDAAATASYSIVGGADQELFTIDTASGELSFTSPRDFEMPSDTDHNNQYEVTVRVTDDTGLTDEKNFTVLITDVNEFAPVITSNGGGTGAAINVAAGTTTVTTVTASDADGSDTVKYYVGGKDMARFNINESSGELVFKTAPDISVPADIGANNVYDILVMAFDGNSFDLQAIAVTVVEGMSNLTVSFAGDGSGSINSDPAGINCSAPSCPDTAFVTGSDVVMTPTPAVGSLFNRWSANCSPTGNTNCTITMDADKEVLATFDSLRWIRINSAPDKFYGALKGAYEAAADLDDIQLSSSALLNEELIIDRELNVILSGGYDGDWFNSGVSTLHGSIRISTGRLTVSNLRIQP